MDYYLLIFAVSVWYKTELGNLSKYEELNALNLLKVIVNKVNHLRYLTATYQLHPTISKFDIHFLLPNFALTGFLHEA